MGHNARFRMWQTENWQGYAPTIGRMWSRGWSLSAHCGLCRLAMIADPEVVMRAKGRDWSPWDKSAKCRRMHCGGRMRLRGYDPRANEFIEIRKSPDCSGDFWSYQRRADPLHSRITELSRLSTKPTAVISVVR